MKVLAPETVVKDEECTDCGPHAPVIFLDPPPRWEGEYDFECLGCGKHWGSDFPQ